MEQDNPFRKTGMVMERDTHRTGGLEEDGDLLVLQHQLQEKPADEARDVPRDGHIPSLGRGLEEFTEHLQRTAAG